MSGSQARGAFSRDEIAFVHRIAPYLAEGIRLALLIQSVDSVDLAESPGLILLAPDGSVIAKNAAADQWLDELNASKDDSLPIEISAVAARLRSLAPTTRAPLGDTPGVRVARCEPRRSRRDHPVRDA